MTGAEDQTCCVVVVELKNCGGPYVLLWLRSFFLVQRCKYPFSCGKYWQLPVVNKATKNRQFLAVVRQQQRKEGYTVLAVSWLQEPLQWLQKGLKSWLLFQSFWDVFMQSLILALVYLPGIRAPWHIHRHSGKLVHQKVAASAWAFHCKQKRARREACFAHGCLILPC